VELRCDVVVDGTAEVHTLDDGTDGGCEGRQRAPGVRRVGPGGGNPFGRAGSRQEAVHQAGERRIDHGSLLRRGDRWRPPARSPSADVVASTLHTVRRRSPSSSMEARSEVPGAVPGPGGKLGRRLQGAHEMNDDHDRVRIAARWVLGAFLVVAGTGHLTVQRDEFQAQVPSWFPVEADTVVVVPGRRAAARRALIFSGRRSAPVGVVVAGFFVVIFPATSPSSSRATARSGWTAMRRASCVAVPAGARALGAVVDRRVALAAHPVGSADLRTRRPAGAVRRSASDRVLDPAVLARGRGSAASAGVRASAPWARPGRAAERTGRAPRTG
jgi:uncharacterized membrane protein